MTSRATAVVVLGIAVAMLVLLLEQRAANDRILSTLIDVTGALATQTTRARGLDQQVAALSERVIALEKDVIDLRRRVARLSRRSIGVAHAAPVPLDSIALAPWSSSPGPQPHDPGTAVHDPAPDVVIETLPITWSTDIRSYQPAGIIAPAAPIVLERKLTDPSFVKKLYVSYAALQAADVITTTAGLSSGNAREGNPLLRGAAQSPAAMIGVKAATTAATIFTIEKLRKKNPVAASVTLIVINATMAAVTINNVAVTSQNRSKR